MLSILFILRYVSTRSIVSLVLGGVSFFLALVSKETGITFLAIIPLIIFFFTDQPGKKIITISMILVGLTGIWLLLRMIIFKDLNQSAGVANSLLNNTLNGAPDFISRQATAFYVLLRYVRLLIFPHPLSCDYNFAQIEIKNLSDPAALFAIVLYFALGIYGLINFRKKSIIAFAILFYLITLAPVSNVFFIGGSTMAERFMYMPSLGFCIILTYFLIKLTKTENLKSRFSNLSKFFSVNSFLFMFVFGFIILYSVKTFSRNKDWKDNVTLFGHDVNVSENSATAHFILGTSLLYDVYPNEKDKVKQDSLLNDIISELSRGNEIVSAASTYAPSYNYQLGIAYMYKKDPKNALINLEMYRDKYIKPEIEFITGFAVFTMN
ncbi:MAG: protein O-mannosyl-transferase TMTC1-related protein [Chitinophagaceae bacterium]